MVNFICKENKHTGNIDRTDKAFYLKNYRLYFDAKADHRYGDENKLSELMKKITVALEGTYNKEKDALKLKESSKEGSLIHLVCEVIKGGTTHQKKNFLPRIRKWRDGSRFLAEKRTLCNRRNDGSSVMDWI